MAATSPPSQPLDLTPIKAYLEVAAKLGYSGTGLRHMAELVDEVERLTNRLNWLERCMGQKPDFTGSGASPGLGRFRCVCCGQVASKSEVHRCEKGQGEVGS